MYKNLSTYLDFLDAHNELVRIKTFVDPILEMAEVADRMAKQPNGGKALLFENSGTEFPVLMNMYGSERRIAHALGVARIDSIGERIGALFASIMQPRKNLWEQLQLLPTLAQASRWMPRTVSGRGQCQQVIQREPDLSALPILQCWPCDGGRFITLPMVHTCDLQTGVRNVGMYRMQVFDARTTGMHWHRHKTGARHFEQYHRAGQRMPVAVTLGGDPVYAYCATAPLPDNVDEYLLAGFLRNYPVRLVRCISQPVCVPDDADFVIEGYVDPTEPLTVEGPFGDHTGFYSLKDLYPRLHVTAVTHRKNAIYPATVVGIPPQEDAYIGMATERIFLAPIRFAMLPEIEDMHLPTEGVAHNIAVVKIAKRYVGQVEKVANALWGAGQMMFNKIMVVVDGNVNVRNPHEVVAAIRCYYLPARDTYFGRGVLDVLDHSAQDCGYGGKMCIDATRKINGSADCTDDTDFISTDSSQLVLLNAAAQREPLIKVLLDENVAASDLPQCVWLLGNNVDPARDCRVENNVLTIDARSAHKSAAIVRPWPNPVCASPATVEAVDKKWSELGIGEHIPSPSLRYKGLLQGNEAQAN